MMTWEASRMATAVKIKILRDANFTNREIIEAAKSGLVDELVGKEVQHGS